MGHHDGIHRFTPGQRRGVGVAANTPIYVIRTERSTGRVVVGPRAALERSSVRVSPGSVYTDAGRVEVKLRYRSNPVWATVRPEVDGFSLELDDPVVGHRARADRGALRERPGGRRGHDRVDQTRRV